MANGEASSGPLTRFPAFDGIRAMAALLVIFSHCPQVADSAVYSALWQVNQTGRFTFVALDIFFVLSGFFITRLLLRERARSGTISFSDFYLRRALRIFPVYYLAVIACIVIFRFPTADALSLLTYTYDIYHPLQGVPNPLEHTWSLSVEEQFYLFWPLLVLLVPQRRLSVVMGAVVPLLAVVSGLVMAALLIGSDAREAGDLVYMSPLTRMLSLSIGGWLALRDCENRPLRGWRCLALLAGAVMLLGLDRVARNHGLITSQPLYWVIALVAYAMISTSFIATMLFDRGRIQRGMAAVLSLAPMRALGKMSYALYVFHLPVLFYFGLNDAALNGAKVPVLQVDLALAITLGLAILSYVLLESPLARLKDSLGQARASARLQRA